jgi:Tfp pilus assembly protein PilF
MDYYLSGVKIDPGHLGCIHNVGCCQYSCGKYTNAEKWFNLAIKVDPLFQDSYLGSTISSLKLGKYEVAFQTIKTLNEMAEWTSLSYK